MVLTKVCSHMGALDTNHHLEILKVRMDYQERASKEFISNQKNSGYLSKKSSTTLFTG